MPRLILRKEDFTFSVDFESTETVSDILVNLSNLSAQLGRSSLSLSPTGPPLLASTPMSELLSPSNQSGAVVLHILPSVTPAQTNRTPGIISHKSLNHLRNRWIKIYTTLEASELELLLKIPSRGVKWSWSRISLFVSLVSSRYEEGKYKLLNKDNGVNISISEDLHLLAGNYSILPLDDSILPLVIDKQGYSIIPRGSLKRTHSSSTISSTENESEHADTNTASELVLQASTSFTKRGKGFKENLYTRDNHCVITREYTELEASHILAHAWSKRSDQLPEKIREAVSEMSSIDDPRNGILLHRSLANAFDAGKFSFRYMNDHDLEVVALDPKFAKYDGRLLDTNDRVREDGTTWWEDWQPLPEIVDFHLQNSVFKNLRAGAGPMKEIKDDDEEMVAAEATGTDEVANEKVLSYLETLPSTSAATLLEQE